MMQALHFNLHLALLVCAYAINFGKMDVECLTKMLWSSLRAEHCRKEGASSLLKYRGFCQRSRRRLGVGKGTDSLDPSDEAR